MSGGGGRGKKRGGDDHVNHEAWAIPYGDLVTLLLAFFVVMYSVSSLNTGKYRVMSEALMAATGAVHEEAHRAKPDMLASAQVYFAIRESLPVPVAKLPKGAPVDPVEASDAA